MGEPVSWAGSYGVTHLVLFYASGRQYRDGVIPFIHEGLRSGEPVLVAVPGDRATALPEALRGPADGVSFTDMAVLGRNPARIIPAVLEFVGKHSGQRVRVVCEPAWPDRSAEENCEVARHEALLNQAMAAMPAAILCPYDSRRLAPAVIEDAARAHPAISIRGLGQRNSIYRGPAVPARCDSPLPAPPATAERYDYRCDLHSLRQWVAHHASTTGLATEQAADLMIAVSELAANTLRHAAGGGTAYTWSTADHILCEIHDQGYITDPLVGRWPPDEHGHGLWVVNQICDLVEIRSSPRGTTIRVRISRDRRQPPGAA